MDRIGEINYNNKGERIVIVKYENCNNITVKFDDGYITKVSYSSIKRGTIKNPYTPVIANVGYFGEGIYKSTKNKKHTLYYNVWKEMIRRCYDTTKQKITPTYKDCTVCKEWHNFQNFAEWYNKNFYQIENEVMCLDKDILHKGNKIYSPDTCVFVPMSINSLFTKRQNNRGSCPIGVYFDKSKSDNIYKVVSNDVYLGYCQTIEQAFEKYKNHKEKRIKEVAEQYKDKIPKKLYNAMMKYEVEITD